MKKILIVDDSATMRKILMRTIRQAGLDCAGIVEAGNGAEGLQQLISDAEIDLILSDVNMPVMGGLEFVTAVRAKPNGGAVPIVMVTTEGGDAMLQGAMNAGASGYVTKPFTPDSFRTAVLSALAK